MVWMMSQTTLPRTTSTMPVELINLTEANPDHWQRVIFVIQRLKIFRVLTIILSNDRHEWKFMEEATKDMKVQLHATLKLEATRFTMKVNQRTTRIKMPSPALQIGRHVRRDVVDEVEGGARGVPTVASGTRPDQT